LPIVAILAQAASVSQESAAKWTDVVTALATVAAAVATIATLVFFGLQLRAQARAMLAERESSDRNLRVANQTNKSALINGLTAEHRQLLEYYLADPLLYAHFHGGEPVPSSPELQTRVRVLAEIWVNFMSSIVKNEIVPPELRQYWVLYFKDVARSSPAIQEYWALHRDYFASQSGRFSTIWEALREHRDRQAERERAWRWEGTPYVITSAVGTRIETPTLFVSGTDYAGSASMLYGIAA
jgi:hypothetical protein